MNLNPTRNEPARQPETVAPGFISPDKRAIVRPASTASPRHRSISRSTAAASGSIFFNGWRSTPGPDAATSQLPAPSSITRTSVLNCSKATIERLRSFACTHGEPPSVDQATMVPRPPAVCPIASLKQDFTPLLCVQLGNQVIPLAETQPPGCSYPDDVPGWDPLFQHFAIVVSDMTAAYANLQALHNWTPISTDGPQILPPSSGGVTAFKFRDPEGHPLEMLAFRPGATPAHWAFRSGNLCLGIDHSVRALPQNRAQRVLPCRLPKEGLPVAGRAADRSRFLDARVQRGAPASRTVVLRQNPDADPP